ncbi:DUF4388 domain-containing protein [candidate division WOR-3 bacterium]|nr:DUF4388 domain-containing protein [candidate division WOR-3 bacterium]
MAIQCNVTDASPSELLFFLSHFKKTGTLKLQSKNSSGEIFVKSGRIVHAVSKETVGLEALYNLAMIQEGQVSFAQDEVPSSETIAEESMQVISEAERRRSELADLMKRVPPLETVLQRAMRLSSDEEVTLRKSDWKVFVMTDGKTPLRKIIETSNIGILEVYASITWLLEKNYIVDPVAAIRNLKISLLKLNELVKEFGEGGVGVPSWISFLKEQVRKYDPDDSKLGPFLIWNAESIEVQEQNISPKNGAVLNEFLQKLIAIILEKAVNDYGRIIAKRKYDQVIKRIS